MRIVSIDRTGFAAAAVVRTDDHGVEIALPITSVQGNSNSTVPVSVLDLLECDRTMHSWSLPASLRHIESEGKGVVVLLNCGESAGELLAQFEGTARAAQAPERGRMDLRTYGIGAQILRDCGVHKMRLMSNPRRMPSMVGYGLESTGYLTPPAEGTT